MISPLPIQATNQQKSALFNYLLLLTAFFVAMELSLFIQSSALYLGDIKFVSGRLKIPGMIFPGILFFFAVQIALHLLFTVVVWTQTKLMSVALQWQQKTMEKMGIALWFLGIVTVLLANQYLYPNSKFAELTSFVISKKIVGFLLSSCLISLLLTMVIAGWGLLLVTTRRVKAALVIGAMLTAGFMYQHGKVPVTMDGATAQQPNIIMIGIDAVRPDFLGYFGGVKNTPHIDAFLNQATVFADAITPIARTFPAWVSMLTGNYPKRHGVRFDLQKVNGTDFAFNTTLPMMLRQQGYQTLFATDETRFSNIDHAFGFDKIVTPPIGLNDFLLGTINDFPMANLLVNTALGRYLFSHSYGNRAVYITYDPNSFLKLIQPELAQARQKPLFLAVHFCLPHYPYMWSGYQTSHKTVRDYHQALQRADLQFHDFLTLLKENNVLQNSIVVLMSDHGEAFELPGDRVTDKELFIAGSQNKNRTVPKFYPPSVNTEAVNQSAGHGTDVLGLTQYHSVLAFRLYGEKKNQLVAIPDKVSLIDIKPTLLELAHYPLPSVTDGRSLAAIILGKKSALAEKDLFVESDFSPQAVRSVHPETRKLLFAGIDYFQIDQASARIEIKKSMGPLIISSKQYADIYQHWMLALYPQSNAHMTPVLVNLETGEWTNDLTAEFALHSPAGRMLQALKNFYGNEITRVSAS